jgi:hypothetical protein
VSITLKLLLEKQVWCRLDSGGLGWRRIVPFATCFLEAPCGDGCSADNHPVLLRTGEQLSLYESRRKMSLTSPCTELGKL